MYEPRIKILKRRKYEKSILDPELMRDVIEISENETMIMLEATKYRIVSTLFPKFWLARQIYFDMKGVWPDTYELVKRTGIGGRCRWHDQDLELLADYSQSKGLWAFESVVMMRMPKALASKCIDEMPNQYDVILSIELCLAHGGTDAKRKFEINLKEIASKNRIGFPALSKSLQNLVEKGILERHPSGERMYYTWK